MSKFTRCLKSYAIASAVICAMSYAYAAMKHGAQRISAPLHKCVTLRTQWTAQRGFWDPSVGKVMQWPADREGQLKKYAVALENEAWVSGYGALLEPAFSGHTHQGHSKERFELSNFDFSSSADEYELGAPKNKTHYVNTIQQYDRATEDASRARAQFESLQKEIEYLRKSSAGVFVAGTFVSAQELPHYVQQLVAQMQTAKDAWEKARDNQVCLYYQLRKYETSMYPAKTLEQGDTLSSFWSALPYAMGVSKALTVYKALAAQTIEQAEQGNFEAVKDLVPCLREQRSLVEQLGSQEISPAISCDERKALGKVAAASSATERNAALSKFYRLAYRKNIVRVDRTPGKQ